MVAAGRQNDLHAAVPTGRMVTLKICRSMRFSEAARSLMLKSLKPIGSLCQRELVPIDFVGEVGYSREIDAELETAFSVGVATIGDRDDQQGNRNRQNAESNPPGKSIHDDCGSPFPEIGILDLALALLGQDLRFLFRRFLGDVLVGQDAHDATSRHVEANVRVFVYFQLEFVFLLADLGDDANDAAGR